MYALISPNEFINISNEQIGSRVAQVSDTVFDVAEPLFWVSTDLNEPAHNLVWQNNILVKLSDVIDANINYISMRQARLIFLQLGLLNKIEPLLSSLPSPQKETLQIEWEYATVINKDSELMKQISIGLVLSSDQVDQLFIDASKL